MVPLHLKETEMSWDDIVYGVWCSNENLQVLCSTPQKLLPKGQRSCHALKSKEESFCRDRWQQLKLKYKKWTPTEEEIESNTKRFKQEYIDYLELKRLETEAK